MNLIKMNLLKYDLSFSIANNEEFYEIKHFLKRNKTHSANRDDIIYLVRAGTSIIGLARLLKIDDQAGALWLRGLYIQDPWRNKGIASQLLLEILQSQQNQFKTKSLFAFAEPHLAPFYNHNKYEIIDKSALPQSLKQKYCNAQEQGKNWLCLVKSIN